MKTIVGTSGFSYSHWKGKFYPEDVPRDGWLEFYARRFNGVEINSSFYHLPFENVLRSWHRRTPEDFVFVLKGSRFVTHRCRLRNCKEPLQLFYRRVALLGKKVGAVLWQLPPGLQVDPQLLHNFLGSLPKRPSCVIEFRNPSWYREEIFALLEKHGAT
ncbi:MAG: DUF72 domain-containing protein, partial [Kiritimatiellae bacterium]|nr:DUF72 domain-containing protein [Kiritimatiellia bacterium]